MEIKFKSNADAVADELRASVERALTRCGMQAEGYAKDLCPVDTGALRNTITYKVDTSELSVYVGTNSEYGAYVEFGTGEHYPGGRQGGWAYKDDKGDWHWTHGNRAQPFIEPAVSDHAQTYRNIIKDELSK